MLRVLIMEHLARHRARPTHGPSNRRACRWPFLSGTHEFACFRRAGLQTNCGSVHNKTDPVDTVA